jgi:hypothetical protein
VGIAYIRPATTFVYLALAVAFALGLAANFASNASNRGHPHLLDKQAFKVSEKIFQNFGALLARHRTAVN